MIKENKTHAERRKELMERIEKAKKDIAKLEEKRKKEIGELAIKNGLSDVDNNTLKDAFKKLSNELAHADAS